MMWTQEAVFAFNNNILKCLLEEETSAALHPLSDARSWKAALWEVLLNLCTIKAHFWWKWHCSLMLLTDCSLAVWTGSGLIADIFQSQCPVFVCHLGFSFIYSTGVIYDGHFENFPSPEPRAVGYRKVKQPWRQSHLTWWLWEVRQLKEVLRSRETLASFVYLFIFTPSWIK